MVALYFKILIDRHSMDGSESLQEKWNILFICARRLSGPLFCPINEGDRSYGDKVILFSQLPLWIPKRILWTFANALSYNFLNLDWYFFKFPFYFFTARFVYFVNFVPPPILYPCLLVFLGSNIITGGWWAPNSNQLLWLSYFYSRKSLSRVLCNDPICLYFTFRFFVFDLNNFT